MRIFIVFIDLYIVNILIYKDKLSCIGLFRVKLISVKY